MKARQVKQILNVTQQTLRNYIAKGILHPIRVSKTHYEYDDNEVYSLVGKNKASDRLTLTYSRVSQPKQKDDLDRQKQRLYDFAASNGYQLSMQLSDIKSGMEFEKRKDFIKLIRLVCENRVKTVIVENKDRLVRFGFSLIKEMFKQHGTDIVVMSDTPNKTYEQELTDDLISIIHYYSMKSYSNRRKLNNAEKALKEEEN